MAMSKPKRARNVVLPQSIHACRTCRQRRIKCDGERPICRKCIKSDRKCEGYAVWDLSVAATGTTAQRAAPNSVDEPSSTLVNTTTTTTLSLPGQAGWISPAPTHRVQILADFCQVHFPAARPGTAPIPSVLTTVEIRPATDVLERTLNTFSLTHLAEKHRGGSYEFALRACYSQTVSALMHTLSAQRHNLDPVRQRELLVSLLLLSYCEDSIHGTLDTQSPTNSDAWMVHIFAVMELIATHGVGWYRAVNALDRSVVLTVDGFCGFVALGCRRGLHRARSWPEVSNWNTWQMKCLRVLPGMLERLDCVLNPNDLTIKYEDVRLLVEALADLSNQCAFTDDMIPTVTVRQRALFDREIEEHRVILESSPFDSFYHFQKETELRYTERDVVLTLLFSLIINCSLLRVAYCYPGADQLLSSYEVAVLESQAYGRARDLCRSTFTISKNNKLANTGGLLLYHKAAKRFFEQHKDWEEMTWCAKCIDATTTRLKRITKTAPRSGCKVLRVTPGIVGACNYLPAWVGRQ